MEESADNSKAALREKQSELIKLIEALTKLDQSDEWNTLKELVFDRSLKSIERQMLNAITEVKIDSDKLYRLQGEWAWAKKYTDINKYVESLKKQLEEIKKILK